MTETSNVKLQSAAEKLIKWDERRTKTAGILGFDIAVAPRSSYVGDSRAWAVSDLRVWPSLFVTARVARANNDFCEVVSEVAGAEKVTDKDALPSRILGEGHPRDPLLEFPNGLILKSVAAAHYMLGHMADTLPGPQDPLQAA
jgi:hypothetical protein